MKDFDWQKFKERVGSEQDIALVDYETYVTHVVDKAVLLPRAAPRLPTTMTIPGVATAAPAPRAERPIEFGVKATVEAVLSALTE